MSNYHFGDDYDLNYYPPEASDGMGGVDWDKVERVEIECDIYVKERTCHSVSKPGHSFRCSECDATDLDFPDPDFCHGCGAKVVK